MGDPSDVAEKDTIAPGIFDDLEESFFAGLLDARGRKDDLCGPSLTHEGNCFLVPPDIFVIDQNLHDPGVERGRQLLRGPAEHCKLRVC